MDPTLDYRISTNQEEMDVDAIHEYLTRSYWAAGIPRDVVARSIEGSLCFGIFLGTAQVGFARVITDRATYGYLADVYVLEEHRGIGLSKRLMATVLAHADLQGLRRIQLRTRDAHGLYRQFGFTQNAKPESLMELQRPLAYGG
ncbi:MAG TPA: GNAT family N-acetyltransferase [Trueperaceae bacterium]|nr:GNAT family N-acetyltransferase [Trueperaceae bacterium]